MGIRAIGELLDATEGLDRLAHPACRAATRLLPRGPVKDILHGFGWVIRCTRCSPICPLGFGTSAFVVDLVGGRRARPAADALVGVGVAAALPTTAAGPADWSELNEPERRAGLIHAVANLSATALYGLSFLARRSGRRTRGVILVLAGAAAATAGGFLGGHLTYRRAAGVNHAADAPTNTEWAEVAVDGTLNRHNPTLAHLNGSPLAAVGGDTAPAALLGRCSVLSGPLAEGGLVDGCLRCPWHSSTFRMSDGTVVRGPTTAPQSAYELRVDGQRVQARRRLDREGTP